MEEYGQDKEQEFCGKFSDDVTVFTKKLENAYPGAGVAFEKLTRKGVNASDLKFLLSLSDCCESTPGVGPFRWEWVSMRKMSKEARKFADKSKRLNESISVDHHDLSNKGLDGLPQALQQYAACLEDQAEALMRAKRNNGDFLKNDLEISLLKLVHLATGKWFYTEIADLLTAVFSLEEPMDPDALRIRSQRRLKKDGEPALLHQMQITDRVFHKNP